VGEEFAILADGGALVAHTQREKDKLLIRV
jgi:hypothetical protein